MEKYANAKHGSDLEKSPFSVTSPYTEGDLSTPTRSPSRREFSRTHINEKKLLWKIDLSILPILFCAYFLQVRMTTSSSNQIDMS